jgi:pyruvate,water dikinase
MHISKFGYHSERELDVSYPCYFEDVEKIIQMIKDTALLDESYSPGVDTWKQYQNYQTQLEKIQKQVSSKKYAKILKKLQKLRSMLWWREEFKDVSTYFYCLIRIFTKRLAVHYCQKGILDCEEDIWFIKIGDLFAYMEKRVNAKDLHSIIDRNKKYFASFRNFRNENEIGSVFDQPCSEAANGSNRIVGTGCSNGVVTGIARVILDITEIDQIERDDILVTKFTDTGWTSKFAILKGIVTEHGGILCHAAIVSREYGIPCIVSCNDVTKKIQNGSKITINGTTGVINHEEEVCQC